MTTEAIESLDFLAGGGEMGERMRSARWAHSAVGPAQGWPQGLRTAVRMLLNTRHPLFIFWGPQLICFYNDAYRRSLGDEKHPAMLGAPAATMWAEIWDIIGPQIVQVMSGDGSTWHENQLVPILRHGELQDVYWTYSFSPIDEPSAASGVGGVLVICTETTSQVQSQRRLLAESASLSQLFERAPSFMAVLRGPRHVLELANPSFTQLFGSRDIVGRSVADIAPEAVAQGYIDILDEVYRSGTAYRAHGARFGFETTPGAAPDLRYLDFVYQPMTDANGAVDGIFVAGMDVTQRAAGEKALLDADRRKDEFLAMLAHELRNPLAPIRNAVEILGRRVPPSGPEQTAVHIVKRQVNQLTRLVDDLLDVSRISLGRITLDSRIVDLAELIDHALEAVGPLVREKQQELAVVEAAQTLYVTGDAARLAQLLLNILTNAAKYTDTGGRIRIRTAAAEDRVVIEVQDSGCGISAELLPHVFDLFVQGERSLDRAQGGLGIGLNVVKKLVDLHGGEVEVHSEGLGRGSTFTVRLPRAAAPVAQTPQPQMDRAAPMRVLVVDDNVDAATSIAQLLSLDGHDTDAVFTADAAIARARTFAPDIALLDIGLPDMNGYELAGLLRADPALVGLKLVALTGYGQAEDKERARQAGFDAYLVKPVDFDELENCLKSLRPDR